MSDGDSATHGPDADDIRAYRKRRQDREAPRRGSGSGPTQTATIAHRWVGRPTREPLHRTPAEPVDVPAMARQRQPRHRGSHTEGGLSVADLIAKVGGSVADRPRHHHAAPDETEAPTRLPAARR